MSEQQKTQEEIDAEAAAAAEAQRIADEEAAKNGGKGAGGAGAGAGGGNASKAEEGLRKEIQTLREEQRVKDEQHTADMGALVKTIEPFRKLITPDKKSDEQPKLDTTEGWMSLIDTKAKGAMEPLLNDIQKIKVVHKKKALRNFVQAHPEYNPETPEGKARLATLEATFNRVKTRSDLDSEEILEDMQDAWAIENRSTLSESERKLREQQDDAAQFTADVAASGAGSHHREVDTSRATPEDIRIARTINMDIKKYMSLKTQAAQMEIN